MTQLLNPLPVNPNWRVYQVTMSTKRVAELSRKRESFEEEVKAVNDLNRTATVKGYFYFVTP